MNVNEHVSDLELERFLRRRDRLSQDYAALGDEGPPAELDARVLEQARRAAEEDTGHPFWRRANWPRVPRHRLPPHRRRLHRLRQREPRLAHPDRRVP